MANAGRSPAGVNNGVVPVDDVKYRYDEGDRTILTAAKVNYFRNRPGQGIVLWEQLTLQGDFTALSFLSVRRIFDIIQLSISQALESSLQEPNDDFLVAQIEQGGTQRIRKSECSVIHGHTDQST